MPRKSQYFPIPINLEQAEAEFGNERVYRRGRKRDFLPQEAQSTKGIFCRDCGKLGYESESAARIIIGRMLRNRTLSGPESYSFRPYLCVHGYWHNGHDYRSRQAVESFLHVLPHVTFPPTHASA